MAAIQRRSRIWRATVRFFARRRTWRWVFATTLVPLVLMAYVFLAPFTPIEDRMTLPGAVVLASDGEVIWHDGADGLRIPVELGEVSPIMIEATIAAEDGRFWRHPGVDPLAVVRAAREYRSNPSGASTITQQLARRSYLEDSDSPLLVRKAREALIALQIEAHYSKDEILSAYLNSVFYGRGAYGVEAAARVYFGVSAAQLDLAQAAFLTGLPQLPATYASDLEVRPRNGHSRERLGGPGMPSIGGAMIADRPEFAV